MVTEFAGEEFPDTPFPTGEDVLKFYEIEDTDREQDVSSIVCSLANEVLWCLRISSLVKRPGKNENPKWKEKHVLTQNILYSFGI